MPWFGLFYQPGYHGIAQVQNHYRWISSLLECSHRKVALIVHSAFYNGTVLLLIRVEAISK
jgi:hypothetical protein